MFFLCRSSFLFLRLEAEGSSDSGRQDDSEDDAADYDHDLLLQGGKKAQTDFSILTRHLK